MVVVLLRILATMVFGECVASVNTRLTVVVDASTILSVAGTGHASGQRREKDNQQNFLHLQTSLSESGSGLPVSI
jgi:putative copper export protein